MSTQYEVEHNVKFTEPRRCRRVDMASFFSLLDQITTEPRQTDSGNATPHHNPHAAPTPVDSAALFSMLRDQLLTLSGTAPTADNANFLEQLAMSLEEDINDPPTKLQGVNQEFLDTLDRVNRKNLGKDEDCPICKINYVEDEYCLVVELPCDGRHRYDLDCIGPWLRSKGSCPMCRQSLTKRKFEIPPDDEEIEDPDMMYA